MTRPSRRPSPAVPEVLDADGIDPIGDEPDEEEADFDELDDDPDLDDLEDDETTDLIDGYNTPGAGYDPYTRWKDENL